MKTFVALVVVVLFLTLFAVENTAPILLQFMSMGVAVPASLAIIMPLGIALLFFALFHFGTLGKAEAVIRDLEDNVERAQKELLSATNRKMKIRLGDETDTDANSL